MSTDPTFICLTPVKNESWILDRFLQCASTWADHVVVADQQSDDDSRSIARRYPKVHLVDNDSDAYDEGARQRLLLREARSLPAEGRRILIALDADEMLSANWMSSADWGAIQAAEPGTVLYFRWINLLPGLEEGWASEMKPFGYVDDGRPHQGHAIHSPRIPVREGAPALFCEDVRVLHYQHANWARMKSKQRWYQCWERLNHPEKRPVTLFRQYHRMDAARDTAEPVDPSWFRGYEERGIDMRTIDAEARHAWDEDLVRLFLEHGVEPFRKLDVWDADWGATARSMGLPVNGEIDDPRTAFDRRVHGWLKRTQPRSGSLPVRAVQQLLRLGGW
jgi:hypothetical protein